MSCRLLFLALAPALIAPAASAQALYGIHSSSGGLYAISTQDASLRLIGWTGIFNPCGLAIGPDGSLYTFTAEPDPDGYRIDPVTGSVTQLPQGPFFFAASSFFEGSIATDASGVLWATGHQHYVFQFDSVTGAGTPIDWATGVDSMDAIEFRSDGALIGLSRVLQSLVRIDFATHSLVPIAQIVPLIGPTAGMARQNGTTYLTTGGPVGGGSNELYSIDPFSGALTFLGSLGPTITLEGLAGIAQSSRPGIEPFCFGQPGAACPCANTGFGGRGCENSAGTGGAWLQALGTNTPDALVLWSSGELPTALSVFLQGSATIAPAVFGDGLRCVAGTLKRLYTHNAVGGRASAPQAGELSITQRSAALGDPIAPGATRWYQVYYRDPSASFCAAPTGNTWNVSNGLSVVW